MLDSEFHKRLKECRSNSELSQSELAEKVGVQPPVISHFENGKRSPSILTLRKLADALDVSVDYLLGRTPNSQGVSAEPQGNGTIARVHRTLKDLNRKSIEEVLKYTQYVADQQSDDEE